MYASRAIGEKSKVDGGGYAYGRVHRTGRRLNPSTINRVHIEGKAMTTVLHQPALVLNRNWQAINVATVARALVMVWNETARVVDPQSYQLYEWSDWAQLQPEEDEPFIRAVSQKFRVPEVISLASYDKVPSTTVSFSRRNVYRRDRYTCQYCGVQPGTGDLTIDHVVPRSRGGDTSWTNCVLACLDCNSRKADRTPEQVGLRLKKKPVRPAWQPIYAEYAHRIGSWSKFISEAYWNVGLES